MDVGMTHVRLQTKGIIPKKAASAAKDTQYLNDEKNRSFKQ